VLRQLDLFAHITVPAPALPPTPEPPALIIDGRQQHDRPRGIPELVDIQGEITANLGEALGHIEAMNAELADVPRSTTPAPDNEDSDEPGDLCDELMRSLKTMTERADAELQELRRLHAAILGCSVEELDERMAQEKATEQRAKEERRRASPPPAPAPSTAGGKSVGKERPPKATNSHPIPTGPAPKRGDDLAMRRLTPRQQELLAVVRVENGRAVFGSDEHIPDWTALKEVLQALGGRWVTGGRGKDKTQRKGGFVFPEDIDIAETIRLARERGEIFDPKVVSFFPTPETTADRLVGLVEPQAGQVIVEPSAGRGRIAMAVRRVTPDARVLCVELLDTFRAELAGLGFELVGDDFLALEPEALPLVDAVAANPPFENGADAVHFLHMTRFPKPGGKVASIVSAGVLYRPTGASPIVRAWLQRHKGQTVELPEGTFAESGTFVRTAIIVGTACPGCRPMSCR
jgi:hypothetical protein